MIYDINEELAFEEKARKEGEAEGYALAKAEGIIDTCRGFGATDAVVLEKLMTQMEISEEKAHEYLEMFPPKTA